MNTTEEGRTDINGNTEFIYNEETKEWEPNPEFRDPESGRLDQYGNAEFVKEGDQWVKNYAFIGPEAGRMDDFGETEFIEVGGEWIANEDFDSEFVDIPEEAGRTDEEGNFEFVWDYELGKWTNNPVFNAPAPGPDTPPEEPTDEFDPTDPNSKNVPDGYVWCEGPSKWIEQPVIPSDEEDEDGNAKYIWDGSLDEPEWVINPEYKEPENPPVVDPDPDPDPSDEFDPTDPDAENVPEGYVWCNGPSKWVLKPASPSDNTDSDGHYEYVWDGDLDEPAWVLNPDYNAEVNPAPEPDEFDETDPNADAPEGYVWCEGPSKWVLQPECPSDNEDADGDPEYIWDGSLEEPEWVINPDYDDEAPNSVFDPTNPEAEAPEGYVWCEGPQMWVEQPPIPNETTDLDGDPMYIWDGDSEEPKWIINPAYNIEIGEGDEDLNPDD